MKSVASAVLWLIAAMILCVVAGAAGDSIFEPRQMNFSFRVFSDYFVVLLMLITAGICYNKGR